MDNMDLKEHCCAFYEPVISKLGKPNTETDLHTKDFTPDYDSYVNDMTKGTLNASNKNLEPTPEASDNYVNTDVILTWGGTHARRRVIECKRDADGNIIGQDNDNTILDSRHYIIESEYGEVT